MTKNYVLKSIYNDENECINDTLLVRFHDKVLTHSISPQAHGVACQSTKWKLNLSIGLN